MYFPANILEPSKAWTRGCEVNITVTEDPHRAGTPGGWTNEVAVPGEGGQISKFHTDPLAQHWRPHARPRPRDGSTVFEAGVQGTL